MKVSRTREYTVNMGNYESYKFGATVEIESDDVDQANQLLEEAIVKSLSAEIEKTSELTEIRTSYIHTINEDINA